MQIIPNEDSDDSVDKINENINTISTNRRQEIKSDTKKKQNDRKEKRNTGKMYETLKDKIIRENLMKALKPCRNTCNNKFPDEFRQKFSMNFGQWGIIIGECNLYLI